MIFHRLFTDKTNPVHIIYTKYEVLYVLHHPEITKNRYFSCKIDVFYCSENSIAAKILPGDMTCGVLVRVFVADLLVDLELDSLLKKFFGGLGVFKLTSGRSLL